MLANFGEGIVILVVFMIGFIGFWIGRGTAPKDESYTIETVQRVYTYCLK